MAYAQTNATALTAADALALAGSGARTYSRADASADAGAIPETNPKSHAQADARADGDTRKSHGGSRICADAAAFVAADLDADQNSDVCTVGSTHTAADATPDTKPLSGAVE